MCTLTWRQYDHGYEVLFNRDEQRSRTRALAPESVAAESAIYPTDPQGGGTWIALTHLGETYCLLNHYQVAAITSSAEHYLSRGRVIPALLNGSGEPLLTRLAELSLAHFKPFLVCYFPAPTAGLWQPQMVIWDGVSPTELAPTAPLISSSVALDQVLNHRRALYTEYLRQDRSLLDYHRSHAPAPGALSVCMHRDDASTVSLSHISVADNHLRFDYYDGAPCQVSQQEVSSYFGTFANPQAGSV